MIHLKSFIRKRTTKIYIIVFSVICASIMILFAFTNYYSKIIDKLFEQNSIMVVTSKIDHYQKLKEYKVVESIEPIVLLKPNKKINTFKTLPKYIDGVLVNGDELNQNSLSQIPWDSLSLEELNYILVLPDSKNNINLQDNEVATGIREERLLSFQNDIKTVVGEKVGFCLEDETIEFVIHNFFSSKWPVILVSDNVYSQLEEKSKLHSYQLLINNDMASRKLITELKESDTSEELQAIAQTTYNMEDGNSVARFIELSKVLTLVSYVVIIIFIIIFVIIIKNIVNDSKKNILLEKRIGYNNLQIKKNITLQLICFGLLTLIFSSILSMILNYSINCIFALDLGIINLFVGLILYAIMLIIFVYIGLTLKVRINDNQ